MPAPADQRLYDQVKKELYKRQPVHSAYRSGLLVREYKRRFAEKHGPAPAYSGPRPSRGQKGLRRWFAEGWVNESGGVGYDGENRLYRPSRRVSAGTPITWSELSGAEVRSAREEKDATGRVARFRGRK